MIIKENNISPIVKGTLKFWSWFKCFEISIKNEFENFLLGKSCPKPTIEHGEIYAPQRNFEFESEVHISCIEG